MPDETPAGITPEDYRRIEQLIASDASPVGIDAKKTHVLILHKLTEIEKRLSALEQNQPNLPRG
ncbi:MAG: hypothetical protein R3C45_14310 [Phycisphaerales bacterium]